MFHNVNVCKYYSKWSGREFIAKTQVYEINQLCGKYYKKSYTQMQCNKQKIADKPFPTYPDEINSLLVTDPVNKRVFLITYKT